MVEGGVLNGCKSDGRGCLFGRGHLNQYSPPVHTTPPHLRKVIDWMAENYPSAFPLLLFWVCQNHKSCRSSSCYLSVMQSVMDVAQWCFKWFGVSISGRQADRKGWHTHAGTHFFGQFLLCLHVCTHSSARTHAHIHTLTHARTHTHFWPISPELLLG